MKLNPYLTFNGDCEAAFKFYEQHLGGKILLMLPHSSMPAPKPQTPEWQAKILHGTIELGETVVMGSDLPPSHYKTPEGFMVSLDVTSTEEAQRIYDLLRESGTIKMPLGKTPWAESFAMLTDRFGIPWIINYDGQRPSAG